MHICNIKLNDHLNKKICIWQNNHGYLRPEMIDYRIGCSKGKNVPSHTHLKSGRSRLFLFRKCMPPFLSWCLGQNFRGDTTFSNEIMIRISSPGMKRCVPIFVFEPRRSFMLRAVQVDVARRVLMWMLSSWYVGPFVLDIVGWTDIVGSVGYWRDMTLIADSVVNRPEMDDGHPIHYLDVHPFGMWFTIMFSSPIA